MGGRSLGWEGQPVQEPMIQASESQMRTPKTSAYTPVPPPLAAKRKHHKNKEPAYCTPRAVSASWLLTGLSGLFLPYPSER